MLEILQQVAVKNYLKEAESSKKLEFSIEDVKKVIQGKNGNLTFPNYLGGESIPLVDIIHAEMGLFRFQDLSIQESLAEMCGASDSVKEARYCKSEGTVR